MRRLVLVAGLLASVIAGRVHAYACAGPSLHVLLPAQGFLPLDAEVWIVFDDESVTAYEHPEDGSSVVVSEANLQASDVTFTLAREGSSPVVTPATVERMPKTRLPTFVLRPKAELAPFTHYRVSAQSKGTPAVVVARFVTGNARDEHAPTLGKLVTATFAVLDKPEYKQKSGPVARMKFASVSDVETLPLHFEVHDVATTLDASTLRAIVWPREDGEVVLGSTDVCRPLELDFPKTGKTGPKVLKLRVRAVDSAGNASPPGEVTFDVEHPKTKG